MVKNLFSKLLKPADKKSAAKQAHPNSSSKLESLQNEQEIIDFIEAQATLAHEPTALALKKLSTIEAIEPLTKSKHANVRKLAKQAIIEQLPNCVEQITDNQTLILLACYSEDENLAQQAMMQIKDESIYFELAKEQPEPKVRLLAAQQITDESKLSSLQKLFLNKDKALQQYCKQALNQIKQNQEKLEQEKQAIISILENMQSWLRIGFEPELKSKLKVSQSNWAQFNQQSTEQNEQFQKHLSKLSELVIQEEQKQQELEAQQANQRQQEAQQEALYQAISEFFKEAKESYSKDAKARLDKFNTQIKELDAKPNHQIKPLIKPIEQQLKAYKQLANQQKSIEQLLALKPKLEIKELAQTRKKINKIQNLISWPKEFKLPSELIELEKKAELIKQKQSELNKQQPKLASEYKNQLKELETQVNQGQTKEANKTLRQLQQLESKLNEKSFAQFKAATQSLKSQLNEMQNWQNFAVTPKKEELCEKMQALCDSQLPANDLAKEIKALQNQWKELGRGENEKALWERFHSLAEQAFAPCKLHYQQEAETRAENLQKRKSLTQQLLDYEAQMDWSKADWKVVQQTLQQAQAAFKQFSPVESESHKPSLDEFRQAQDGVYKHLKQEYDKNLSKKQALIDKATELAEQEDSREAAEAAKALQQQWKQIGLCPYSADQALWKKFRKQCDVIFAKLKESIQADKQVINNEIKGLEAQLNQAEKTYLADVDQNKKSQLLELKQTIIGASLPKGVSERLLKRWQALEKQQQAAFKEQTQKQQKQAWLNLIELIYALDNNQDLAEPTKLPAHYHWQELLDKNAKAKEDEPQARKLCIALEILENLDSPKEDEPLRMQYQVERLSKNMGKGENKATEKQQIIKQWVNLKKPKELILRFNNALKVQL